MAKMSEKDLLAYLQTAEADAETYATNLSGDNTEFYSAYLCEAQGDEEEGKSQYVSTDVFDLVESDMPSMVRVFLGSSDILEFKPISDDPAEKQEADEKTKYINYLVRQQPGSFKTIHDWLKEAEFSKGAVVKFYIEEAKTTDEREYENLSSDELVMLQQELMSARYVDKLDVVSREDTDEPDTYNVTFRITKKRKKVVIRGVPSENFRISRNASSKDEAILVGDVATKTRGQLIAEGYDKDLVKSLPKAEGDATGGRIKTLRFKGQDSTSDFENHWTNEAVELTDLYVLVDYDGDGIPERRHIVRSGTKILENKPYGVVPYAILSAILMPHAAIGRCRAEIALPTKKLKTQLIRGINNNIYAVNNPRTVVNDDNVELDDMLVHKLGGIVRTSGVPAQDIMALVTPYIGTQALEIVQYVDAMRAQSTGSLMASQGLEVSNLTKETATRFEGVRDASEAKTELMARVYAETGFRDLYDGLAWLVTHYQDEACEIKVLGKPLTVDPRKWKYEHYAQSTVGLAAGDSQEMLQNIGAVIGIQDQLKAQGSMLVDEKKRYNALAKMLKAMGTASVQDYFNDPEQPQQLLMAQLEQAMMMVQALQQQIQQNPLADAEKIKAQAKLIEAKSKEDVEAAKLQQSMRQFVMKMAQEDKHFAMTLAKDLTKIEVDSSVNVPGALT